MSGFPEIALDEERKPNFLQEYQHRILERYRIRGQDIIREIQTYVGRIAQPNFKKFNSLEDYCKEHSL